MQRAARGRRFAPAHTVFFALACIQAVAGVALWWLPGATGLRHAHEMLLGYAVAVLGGFLFTRMSWPGLLGAVAVWLIGRAAVFADVSGWPAAAMALAFPMVLGVLAGLPFAKAARTGRNLAFAPILGGFTLAEALYQSGRLGLVAEGEARGLFLALDLVAAMLLVMGGRLIPAAMAGIARAKGDSMSNRNAQQLEAISMAGMGWAALCHGLGWPMVALAGWALAGLAALLRLPRWRFRLALSERSLWPLQLGYFWLAAGLAGGALAGWTGWWPLSAALHAVTIGGLGIISTTMMVRTIMLRDRPPVGYPRAMAAATGLLLVAAIARIAGWLEMAAPAWAGAFALTAWFVLSLAWRARRLPPDPS